MMKKTNNKYSRESKQKATDAEWKETGKKSRALQTKHSGEESERARTKREREEARALKRKRDILVIILCALAIFIFCSMLVKENGHSILGLVGDGVAWLFNGLFGSVATFLLIVLLCVSIGFIIAGAFDDENSVVTIIKSAALIIVFAALVFTFRYDISTDPAFVGKDFFEIIAELWGHIGGEHVAGICGGGLAFILQKLVQRVGAFIVLIPATLILFMVVFRLTFSGIASGIATAVRAIASLFTRKKTGDVIEVESEPLDEYDEALVAAGGTVGTGKKVRGTVAAPEISHGTDDSADDAVTIVGSGETEDGPVDEGSIEFVTRGYRSTERTNLEDGEPPMDGEAANDQDAEGDLSDAEIVRGSDENGYTGDGQEPEQEIDLENDANHAFPSEMDDEIKLVTTDDSIEYCPPPISMLKHVEQSEDSVQIETKAREDAKKLEEILHNFNVEARVIRISIGSTVTMFELQPQAGVKVSSIKTLADDIALAMAAPDVRIEAPIPGKAAVGIEVPNKDRRTVYLRDIIDTDAFMNHKSKLAFCVGEEISGNPVIADIAKMPHLLIAGTTGAGKSVCVNGVVMSLIYRCSPNDLRLIMIDPKVVEFQIYNGIPHLLLPVVTEPKKAAAALAWAVQEMENRYKQLAKYNVRDITAYNEFAEQRGLPKLPRIVIFIDELADLMQVAKDSVEDAICRIAQKARAAGMHLIVATQSPRVNVVTGLIKANIPSRIALTVSSIVDSKTILDYGGAEKLLGQGDMLFNPIGSLKPIRVQGAFVSDSEIEEIVKYVNTNSISSTNDTRDIAKEIDSIRVGDKGAHGQTAGSIDSSEETLDEDPLFYEALAIALEMKSISASFIQRKLKVGYSRASRMVDQMFEHGYIGARDGNNPRTVLINEMPKH